MYTTLKLKNINSRRSFRIGDSFHSVLAFGLCVPDRPPLLSCVRYWVLVEARVEWVSSLPQSTAPETTHSLHSTERLHDIFKETPVVAYRRSPDLRDFLFARNFRTQEPPPNPTILLAFSAATLNMDVSLAHTLIMKERTTHLTTLGKYEKSNSKWRANLRTWFIW